MLDAQLGGVLTFLDSLPKVEWPPTSLHNALYEVFGDHNFFNFLSWKIPKNVQKERISCNYIL